MALCRCRCLPCDFKPRLMQDIQRDVMFLPSHSWDIVSMVCYWARHFTLKFFTWLRWKWVLGRTEMVMCTISSMRRNGCRTVCSPWSWNDTRMNRTIDQGVRCIGLQIYYQTINQHLYLHNVRALWALDWYLTTSFKLRWELQCEAGPTCHQHRINVCYLSGMLLTLTARGSTLIVRIWRQILTTKVYPRTVRVNI